MQVLEYYTTHFKDVWRQGKTRGQRVQEKVDGSMTPGVVGPRLEIRRLALEEWVELSRLSKRPHKNVFTVH